MNNAIILHGRPDKSEYYDVNFPSSSNSHWIPWLQKQLLVHDIATVTPEIPLAFEPLYDAWVKEIEHLDMLPETLLVGHSCGAGFWMRYLSEHQNLRVEKVMLIAPSLGFGWEDKSFFDFTIDQALGSRINQLSIFYALDDDPMIIQAAHKIADEVAGAHLREFQKGGHFTFESMKTNQFPELLEALIS